MIDRFKADHTVITVGAERLGHRRELVGKLTLAYGAYLKCGAWRVDFHILDMDMAKIALLNLVITVGKGGLMAPAIVRRVP